MTTKAGTDTAPRGCALSWSEAGRTSTNTARPSSTSSNACSGLRLCTPAATSSRDMRSQGGNLPGASAAAATTTARRGWRRAAVGAATRSGDAEARWLGRHAIRAAGGPEIAVQEAIAQERAGMTEEGRHPGIV